MASYMSIIALCFLVASIESHIIRPNQFRVPPQGMKLEITIHPNSEDSAIVEVMEVAPLGGALKESRDKITELTTTDLPRIENRESITVGLCPIGYVRRGGFCFPDYD